MLLSLNGDHWALISALGRLVDSVDGIFMQER